MCIFKDIDQHNNDSGEGGCSSEKRIGFKLDR